MSVLIIDNACCLWIVSHDRHGVAQNVTLTQVKVTLSWMNSAVSNQTTFSSEQWHDACESRFYSLLCENVMSSSASSILSSQQFASHHFAKYDRETKPETRHELWIQINQRCPGPLSTDSERITVAAGAVHFDRLCLHWNCSARNSKRTRRIRDDFEGCSGVADNTTLSYRQQNVSDVTLTCLQ